jgi:hypothetical protein
MGLSHVLLYKAGVAFNQSTKNEAEWLTNSMAALQRCELCLASPHYDKIDHPIWRTKAGLKLHLWTYHKGITMPQYWLLIGPVIIEVE